MIEIADPGAMRAWSRRERAAGHRIGLVPTMGFLHEGHLRLVDRSRRAASRTVMSLFVNPQQFGPGEDYERYPRDVARDRGLAEVRGVDCLFAPAPATMYREPPAIGFTMGHLTDHLCGPRRPGHFAGVLLVVAKLFNIVEPDVAVFGRKDAQQAVLVSRLASELDFPLAIDVAPIVREPDGLALSSRNMYLAPEERRAAAVLSRSLEEAHTAFARGERRAATVTGMVRDAVNREPRVQLEYVEAVDPRSLQLVDAVGMETLLALAARVGKARLIDNIVLGQGLAADQRLPAP